MAKIKVLFSSNRNPLFETFTDYIEKAFKERPVKLFFENRRLSNSWEDKGHDSFLHKFDLKILNKRLLNIAKTLNQICFLRTAVGTFADTIDALKKKWG